jgi:hypothetical protein
MTAFKQLLASDIIVTPFEVNKSFRFVGAAEHTGSDVGIDGGSAFLYVIIKFSFTLYLKLNKAIIIIINAKKLVFVIIF